MISIGERIKDLRINKKVSISTLASLSGISKGHLSNIENNSSNPSVLILQKLAQALEVKEEYLLTNPSEKLDPEWVELILQAKKAGLSIEEVRNFLAFESWKCILKMPSNET
ncbi:helix-turn-helix domain-containing protein [Fictibacillus phosphorivorans]|uniref:helix-turn-helix domain-containing protein n=1 Tax=Fictibacillus phosphorivorans TaxID=1221500 RepID=UPI002041C375|nr:helix-turn-helix domain-containing protein [Fictibacillus phosphorivorans]MCM3717694.1 helix-turn-helix domain-containing protein [Fictibacillus phosphorivorans]MCM3775594.1 helix-turn-helix domain-containing protein [Fictibacillus phosphorivorans]